MSVLPAAYTPRNVRLDAVTGDVVQCLDRAHAELWLVAGDTGRAPAIVLPVVFDSIDKAARAGEVITGALEAVRAIADEPAPADHEHEYVDVRYTRSVARERRCRLCNHHDEEGS